MTAKLVTNERNLMFSEEFASLLDGAVSVRIATGYIGLSAFAEIKPKLESIVESGGTVSIVVGLGFFEGLTAKMDNALRDFDSFCRKFGGESGVMACASKRFHGKLYVVKKSDGQSLAAIGSSNLSRTGFGGWLEGNLVTSDPLHVEQINGYLDRLDDNNALDIIQVEFPIKEKKTDTKKNKKPKVIFTQYGGELPDISKLKPSFSIPIRVTKASNLNLFLSKGRKEKRKTHPDDVPKSEQRKITVFALRPWYESEMTVGKSHKTPELQAFLPDQLDPWTFSIVTQDGRLCEANFNRKNKDGSDTRSLKELGVDFATNPRDGLGRIVKGYLESLGLITYGEAVTQEMLDEAGVSLLEFYELKKDVFLINF